MDSSFRRADSCRRGVRRWGICRKGARRGADSRRCSGPGRIRRPGRAQRGRKPGVSGRLAARLRHPDGGQLVDHVADRRPGTADLSPQCPGGAQQWRGKPGRELVRVAHLRQDVFGGVSECSDVVEAEHASRTFDGVRMAEQRIHSLGARIPGLDREQHRVHLIEAPCRLVTEELDEARVWCAHRVRPPSLPHGAAMLPLIRASARAFPRVRPRASCPVVPANLAVPSPGDLPV